MELLQPIESLYNLTKTQVKSRKQNIESRISFSFTSLLPSLDTCIRDTAAISIFNVLIGHNILINDSLCYELKGFTRDFSQPPR
jgi:hypothetical protein